MSSTAKTAAQDPVTKTSYDPVALADSLRTAAEKSAKVMGEFATRQAGSVPTLVTDQLGIGKVDSALGHHGTGKSPTGRDTPADL